MVSSDVADNLRESFRAVARSRSGGEVRELHGVSVASAGVTFQMFNAAFLSAPVESETELARRIALAAVHFQARGLQWAYWVGENWLDRSTRKRQRQIFLRHGMRHSVDLPGMEAEFLLPAVRPPAPLDIRRVGTPATRDAFCFIGSLCFNVPLPWFREVFDNDRVFTPFEAWVGYAGQEPVTTVAIVEGAGALGVYNVATVPGQEQRGYAETVMRHALEDSQRRYGIRRSVLQSTPAGQRLYERMGYRNVTRVSVYAS
jgi:hypothetical protein